MPCMAFIKVNVAFIGDYNYSQGKSTPHGEHNCIHHALNTYYW